MNKTLFAVILWTGAICLTPRAEGAPKIQFEQTVYDFGKTSEVATVTGTFRFKNTGDATLKVEPPKPSCGCTIAALKPDTLAPGESGELSFTLYLGQVKAQFDKLIAVKSNDPQTPEVSLALKADYTPLYAVNPMVLSPVLPFGTNDATHFATVIRTDGKPLGIIRLDASQPWITAKVEPGATTNETTARIRVIIKREGPPRRFNEFVHIYSAGQSNTPVSGISLFGLIGGEVSLTPEALYWSVSGAANTPAERPEELLVRRVTVRSSDGKGMELKNPQSTISGIKVELVPKEAGKVYELVARLEEVPTSTVSGNVSFETSVASQPRVDVPVIVNVFKP